MEMLTVEAEWSMAAEAWQAAEEGGLWRMEGDYGA